MLTFNRNNLVEFCHIYARNSSVGNKRKNPVFKSYVGVLNHLSVPQMRVAIGQ